MLLRFGIRWAALLHNKRPAYTPNNVDRSFEIFKHNINAVAIWGELSIA